MARKRSLKKRSKKNSRFINRHSYRRTYRRKDKRKNKKTRKKNKRGGSFVKGEGLVEIVEEEPSIMTSQQSEPDLKSGPLSTLSRFSSSRRVNVDEELLSDKNIGMINGHGMVDDTFFVVPEGICLWVLSSAGNATYATYATYHQISQVDDNDISRNYRRYPSGSLIQEQTVDTLLTQGPGINSKEKLRMREHLIAGYSPSFLLTGKNQYNMTAVAVGAMKVSAADQTDSYGLERAPCISMELENRETIEDLVFSEHDTRIMAKSKLLNNNDGQLEAVNYSLSYLLKTIRDKQGEYGDIPTNWVGTFCRSGTALNLDNIKDQCNFIPGLELDEDDFGGDIEYEQEGESQLTHQSSLSSRRSTSNFKQVVEELYRLFKDNPGEAKIPPGFGDKDQAGLLLNIKKKIDNIEPLSDIEVCRVFLLRKINL